MEQQSLYEMFSVFPGGVCGDMSFGAWSNMASEDWTSRIESATYFTAEERAQFKKGICSISIDYCPTRRGASGTPTKSMRFSDVTGSTGNSRQNGPATDYAITTMYQDAGRNNTDSLNYYDSYPGWVGATFRSESNPTYQDPINNSVRGPFRSAMWGSGSDLTVNDTNVSRNTPRDTIAWWEDGTTNQLIMGEKFIPPNHLYETLHDAQWLASGSWCWVGTGKNFRGGIRRVTDYEGIYPTSADDDNSGSMFFGSWHPIVCNFLVGDSSVRSLAATTPTLLLHRLAHVNDGVMVQLP